MSNQAWFSQPIGSTRNLSSQFVKYRGEARRSKNLASASNEDR